MTKQISSSIEINFMNSNPTIFHLASEYNGTRIHGKQLDMNQLMQLYIQGKWTDNHSYFERTQIQANLIPKWLDIEEENCNFFYGDVSQVPSTGKHNPKEEYQCNVKKSITYHQEIFELYKPYAVCIAGGIALDSFISIILPKLTHRPKYIIGTRNPSNQGHFGSSKDWLTRYQDSQNLEYPMDGHIYKLTYKEHLQKFIFQRWKESKSNSRTKSQTISSTTTPVISCTSSYLLDWDRFECDLKHKDVYISKGPDTQNRYSFSYEKVQVLHEVKMTKNNQVGAGYYSVQFGCSNGIFHFKGIDYKLNKAGHIKIQDALKNNHFFDLILETYNRKKKMSLK